MKKTIFSIISIILLSLSIFLIKFTDGWFVWYLIVLPLALRAILIFIYKKMFYFSQNENKIFNILTALVYILVVVLVIYTIRTVDLGNSWI